MRRSKKGLEGLAQKYRVLIRLRKEREHLEASGIFKLHGHAAKQRQARGRALARRYPGALRELDELTATQLERRLADVESEMAASLRGASSPEREWVRVVIDFHALLREALAIKAWLSGRRKNASMAGLFPPFRRYFSRSPNRQRPLASVDEAFLMSYWRPPNGRLLTLVWRELGLRHRRNEDELRQLVFGE